MAGFTAVQKIINRHTDKKWTAKLTKGVAVSVDTLLTHDVCGPPTIKIFYDEMGVHAKAFSKEGLVIIPDHYIFTNDPLAARAVQVLREFVKEQGITHFYDPGTQHYRGVCHVALPQEGLVKPGDIIFGTDSHTCTHGAFGAYTQGIGNTEAAFILGTGRMIINPPLCMKFDFKGEKFPDYVMGKDIILTIIGNIGVEGADFKAMEFTGAIKSLNVEEMATICNMAIEAGGDGFIAPSQAIVDWILKRNPSVSRAMLDERLSWCFSDDDAPYLKTYTYNAGDLVPVVAMPHTPENVKSARELATTRVTRAYLGSCTGGKTHDFYMAAKLLDAVKGKEVAVLTYLVPATTEQVVAIKTEKIGNRTWEQIFRDSGCNMDSIDKPSCAACLGGPVDTYGRVNKSGEVVISATNRNFVGRMGSKDAQIYLASPLTVMATALTGCITDPREFMR